VADDLEHAHALQQAHEALVASLWADGAIPFTAALRLGLPVDVGFIVRDRVTGLYGVVSYVTIHPFQRAAAR
jgi:hypothetical protein